MVRYTLDTLPPLTEAQRASLKSHGRGYQSRMNAILRREMLSLNSSTAK
ncbi:MAG: BrnA antitoxin family protein [Terracidiphilus sp.]|jgi:hypothetical protein